MAKIKMSKKSTSIDMTAMCDVSFLLLTFFILTATAKQQEPLPVDTPSSTVKTKLPETDLATITIGKDVNAKDSISIFFGVTGRDVRKRTLELMAQKYKLSFSEEEMEQFALIESFGVPVQNLSQIIAMKSSDRNKPGFQPGIPADSTDNQLKEWIYNARIATSEIADKDLNFAIKGDAKQEYPSVKKVMDMLQDQKVNQFDLVTGLRGKDY